jgi:hypothetical protein
MALVKVEHGRKPKLVWYKAHQCSKGDNIFEAAEILYDRIPFGSVWSTLCSTCTLPVAFVEDSYMRWGNAKAARTMTEFSVLVRVNFFLAGYKVELVHPMTAKSYLGLTGKKQRGSKQAVVNAVLERMDGNAVPIRRLQKDTQLNREAVCDAIAVALAGFHKFYPSDEPGS